MNLPKTNQHYNFFTGLPLEYYDENIDNTLEDNDIILINLSRYFRSINGAENPNKEALLFANYLIENGENLLPAIIEFYVDKFKTLPVSIQEYVLERTPLKNNYFREDTGSDKLACFANSLEYSTRSSRVNWNLDQLPDILVSESIKNKISPKVYEKTFELSLITEQMCKQSNATQIKEIEQSSYSNKETISNTTHNNYRTITTTNTHVEAAKRAKEQIQSNSYKAYHDCYRVKREYGFGVNPYDKNKRQDETTQLILDKNLDIVSKDNPAVYTTAGDKVLPNTQKVHDLFDIMPLTREITNNESKKEDQYPPQHGSTGKDTNKLNETAGKNSIKTYDKSKHKN